MQAEISASLKETVARLKSTECGPLVIYDLDVVRKRAEALARQGEKYGVRVLAAIKALPVDDLLTAASNTAGGFDVSNGAELARLHKWRRRLGRSGAGSYASMTGPYMEPTRKYADSRIDTLTVNIEHPSQLSALSWATDWANNVELGARIGVDLHPEPQSPDRIVRFGFLEGDIESLSQLAKHPKFSALHCHLGANAAKKGGHIAAAARLLSIANAAGIKGLKRINLGGGFRDETIEEIGGICKAVRAMLPPDIELVFEPGTWLTTCAGFALCRVVSMRYRGDIDRTVVTTNLSHECHVRWSNPNMIGWWGRPPPTAQLVMFGPTCHDADCLGHFEWRPSSADDPDTEKQWVLLGGVIGYSAAFNVNFNGIDAAKIFTFGDFV